MRVNSRLMIQRAGQPPAAVELTSPVRLGGGAADELNVPGAPEAAATLSPVPDGVVVSARVQLVASGRPLAAGARRLVRSGERLELDGCAVWPEPGPEETRVLAGAILGGWAPCCGPRLLVLDGPAAGTRLPVADGAVVGRARTSEVPLDDPLASRRHLRLRLVDGSCTAEDLGSKNGFAVNGRRTRRGPARLGDGDALRIGSTVLVFHSGGDGVATCAVPRSAAGSPPALGLGARAGGPGPASRTRAAGAVLASGALAAAALALAGVAG